MWMQLTKELEVVDAAMPFDRRGHLASLLTDGTITISSI